MRIYGEVGDSERVRAGPGGRGTAKWASQRPCSGRPTCASNLRQPTAEAPRISRLRRDLPPPNPIDPTKLEKSPAQPEAPPRRSSVRLGLAESDHFVPGLELTAFFEKLDPLETFQNVALRGNGADAFEAAVL